jgi:RND family efflux transporter MFP subunit
MTHAFVVPIGLSLALTISACSGHPSSRSSTLPAQSVETVSATETVLTRSFEAGGVVRARDVASVVSRIMAEVRSVAVRPGDHVRAGQTLVVLDSRELAANRDRAAAGHEASLQGANLAQADKRATEAALTLARVTHQRFSDLRARNSATQNELDEAIAGLRSAEARLAVADARIAEAAALIDSAAATATAARVAASYALLVSPFDGTVTEKLTEPGNMASPGQPLVTVEDTRAFRLDVRLDESRAASVRVGDAAAVRLDRATDSEGSGSSPTDSLTAVVAEVARMLDPGSHDFVVKLDLPSSVGLRSGMFGRAAFRGSSRRGLAIPSSALIRRGQLVFVFVVEADKKAHLRLVDVSEPVGDLVEVRSGLVAGDAVVGEAPMSLMDGSPVLVAAAGDRRK